MKRPRRSAMTVAIIPYACQTGVTAMYYDRTSRSEENPLMTKIQKALAVLVVATLGIWGCAQGPAGSASAERLKALESKANRLEEDFRAASVARDQLRKKLSTAEESTNQLQAELTRLQAVAKERDNLKVDLQTRTEERDHVIANFDIFRKNLRDMLGKTEAAMAQPPMSGHGPMIVTE